MQKMYSLTSLASIELKITGPTLVFLYGDLGAGKTTLCQYLISKYVNLSREKINSPTYVYYNKYNDVYHFDLYRLRDYEEFVSIGGEEILDNNDGIIFVEWPEVLEPYYKPDIHIHISKQSDITKREIRVEYS